MGDTKTTVGRRLDNLSRALAQAGAAAALHAERLALLGDYADCINGSERAALVSVEVGLEGVLGLLDKGRLGDAGYAYTRLLRSQSGAARVFDLSDLGLEEALGAVEYANDEQEVNDPLDIACGCDDQWGPCNAHDEPDGECFRGGEAAAYLRDQQVACQGLK